MLSILGLFIFLLPLALASSNIVEPETLLSSSYFVLLLIFLVIWVITQGLDLKKLGTVKYPLMMSGVLLAAAIPSAAGRIAGLWQISQFTTGLLLFLVVAPLREDKKNRLKSEVALGALVISLLAIFQYYFGFQLLLDYVQKTGAQNAFVMEKIAQRRVFFPFLAPEILGGYLAMTLPLTLYAGKKSFFMIPVGFALILTQSLSAFLSIMVVAIIFYFWKMRSSRKKAFFLLITGAVFGVLFILRSGNEHRHLLPSFSVAARLDYWKETWQLILAHPLTGVGLGNFDLRLSRYAHNLFLQLWAETGLLGIAMLLWLCAVVIKSGWKNIKSAWPDKKKLALLAGIIIFLIHNLMDFSFFLPAVGFIWWIMLGIFYVPAPVTAEEKSPDTTGKI